MSISLCDTLPIVLFTNRDEMPAHNNNVVFIKGFADWVTEKILLYHFAKFGRIIGSHYGRDQFTNEDKRFMHIVYSSYSASNLAVMQAHCSYFVDMDNPNNNRRIEYLQVEIQSDYFLAPADTPSRIGQQVWLGMPLTMADWNYPTFDANSNP